MNTPRLITLLLTGALAAFACGGEGSGPAKDAAPASQAASLPAPWEPIDKAFKGCEGG